LIAERTPQVAFFAAKEYPSPFRDRTIVDLPSQYPRLEGLDVGVTDAIHLGEVCIQPVRKTRYELAKVFLIPSYSRLSLRSA